jgi:hypothetical protein
VGSNLLIPGWFPQILPETSIFSRCFPYSGTFGGMLSSTVKTRQTCVSETSFLGHRAAWIFLERRGVYRAWQHERTAMPQVAATLASAGNPEDCLSGSDRKAENKAENVDSVRRTGGTFQPFEGRSYRAKSVPQGCV